jgi:hypothetical protein
MLKYHFYIPNYTEKSNGIKALWAAAEYFSKYQEVTVESFHMGEIFTKLPIQYAKLLGKFSPYSYNTVVIYPDCVQGNPLNARKIARYLMCKPLILNGTPIDYSFGEFLFGYSRAVNKKLEQYNIILDEKPVKIKNPSKERKNKVSIYYGKVRVSERFDHVCEILKKFDDVYVITRSHPEGSELLYKHLAESKLLISLDPLSNIAYEATLVGTPVYFADDVFRECYDDYNYPLHGFYYRNNIEHIMADFDHEKLMTDSRRCYIEQANKNEEKTVEIMSKIETFFSAKGSKINYDQILNEDIDFYENNWKMSPIYLSTTSNSLIGYHILRKSAYLYLLATYAKGLYDCPQKLKRLVLAMFKPNVIANYLYLKDFDRFKKRLRYQKYKEQDIHLADKECQNTNSHDKYILSTKQIKLLWRI